MKLSRFEQVLMRGAVKNESRFMGFVWLIVVLVLVAGIFLNVKLFLKSGFNIFLTRGIFLAYVLFSLFIVRAYKKVVRAISSDNNQ